jgi:transposase-like protein
MSKRRTFSPEFKRGAVEQRRQLGANCAQVSCEQGSGASLLNRWKREADAEGRHAFGGLDNPREEEVVRLKGKLARVKKERDLFARCGNVLRQGIFLRCQVVGHCCDKLPVRMMCRLLKIFPSGFSDR